jgi:hypothetical protein
MKIINIMKNYNRLIIILSLIYYTIDIFHFYLYRQNEIDYLGVFYEEHFVSYLKWFVILLLLNSAVTNNKKHSFFLGISGVLIYIYIFSKYLLHHSVRGSFIMLIGGLEIIVLLTIFKLFYILSKNILKKYMIKIKK